jgi:hypothetical protein
MLPLTLLQVGLFTWLVSLSFGVLIKSEALVHSHQGFLCLAFN